MRRRTQRESAGSPLLPRGARPCVWMTAGLLSWRLCDRDYDCEHCPLDEVLRGGPEHDAATASAPWVFPDDRRYHRCHTWALPTDASRVRCGLDAFAARLVGEATSIVLPALRSRLARGEVACWLAQGTALIPIRSPIGGAVIRRNGRIHRRPQLVLHTPYDDGWLFEVEATLEADDDLLDAAEARERAQQQVDSIRRRAARHLRVRSVDVGPTAADGGEPLDDLHRRLGAERWRRIVQPFLE